MFLAHDRVHAVRHQRGASMIEILVTIVILAFGLLGLAGLQMHIQGAQFEAYQRAQALVLLDDMAERIAANRSNAADYAAAADAYGTGDGQPADCAGLGAMSVARDLCEWSNALKGSAEVSGGNNVGAMVDARGCIVKVQDANPASGVCQPAIYRVDVVWQGTVPTVAPNVACGENAYGADENRRALSRAITVGLPGCS